VVFFGYLRLTLGIELVHSLTSSKTLALYYFLIFSLFLIVLYPNVLLCMGFEPATE